MTAASIRCSYTVCTARRQATPFHNSASAPRRIASAPPSGRRFVQASGTGQDAVESWIDLASFVASSGKSGGHTAYDELADKIGKDVYIDVAGWHLYLKDVKVGGQMSLAQALAGQLGPKLQSQGFKEADLTALLRQVPIKLGGGCVTLPLADLLPTGAARDFERACEDWVRSR